VPLNSNGRGADHIENDDLLLFRACSFPRERIYQTVA
jgi:hypothetical protein